jgi:hypothetical protein
MRKNPFTISLFLSASVILGIVTPVILPKLTHAECVDGTSTFISTGPSSALLYWRQADCSPPEDYPIKVYYQTSFDNLASWNAKKLLLGPVIVADFDGIIFGNSTLVASYADRENGSPKIFVKVSKDKGKTWLNPKTVFSIPKGDFGCTTLELRFSEELKRFIIRSHIYNGSTATANEYIFSSIDGISWTSSKLGGSNFPTGCNDND